MRKMKKLIALLLVTTTILSFSIIGQISVSARTSIKTQAEAVNWLNAQNGASYNFGDFYDDEGHLWGGTQCVEFVRAYVNYLVNGNPWSDAWNRATLNGNNIWQNSLWAELGWQVYYNTPDFVPQPGDIFSAGTYNAAHTGVVISSDVNTAVVADSNARNTNPYDGDPVYIHQISWRSASSDSAYGATHYIRPNFNSQPQPHIHNYTNYVYYWAAHPHYNCYQCSCGEIKEDRSKPNCLMTCNECKSNIGDSFSATISHSSSGKVLGINQNNQVVLQTPNGSFAQRWQFIRLSDNSYLIMNLSNAKYLDLLNADTTNGNYIQVYDLNSSNAQKWFMSKNGSSYSMISKCHTGKAVDLRNNDTSNGNNIILYERNNSAAQNFTISKLVAPTSVSLSPTSLTLGKGESYSLSKAFTPSNAEQNYTFSSSNTSVASVSSLGKVTAKNTGTATITIKTSNGKTASCKVTVKSAPTSVTTNPTSVTLGVGEKYTVSESTNSGTYANASNLKWSSTNTSVATVAKGSSNKATITAKSVGTTYVKISLYNGKTAQCKVTVKPAPTSVKTNPTSLTLGVGEKYTISESTNSGSYANASNLVWGSTNLSVASVTKGSSNKATITAKSVGTAYIKISLYNGKSALCKVVVKSAPTSVKTNPTSITIKKGATYTISESTNSGSYANASNLKWSSTNTSVATVAKGSSNKAIVTGKKAGTAYIKITLYNGKTAQCKVTVK